MKIVVMPELKTYSYWKRSFFKDWPTCVLDWERMMPDRVHCVETRQVHRIAHPDVDRPLFMCHPWPDGEIWVSDEEIAALVLADWAREHLPNPPPEEDREDAPLLATPSRR